MSQKTIKTIFGTKNRTNKVQTDYDFETDTKIKTHKNTPYDNQRDFNLKKSLVQKKVGF